MPAIANRSSVTPLVHPDQLRWASEEVSLSAAVWHPSWPAHSPKVSGTARKGALAPVVASVLGLPPPLYGTVPSAVPWAISAVSGLVGLHWAAGIASVPPTSTRPSMEAVWVQAISQASIAPLEKPVTITRAGWYWARSEAISAAANPASSTLASRALPQQVP